jgi:hypothetical protein
VKDEVLSILIHGDSKVGKSTLTSTAPPPILVIDAEGSWKFIREAGFKSGVALRRTNWDPLQAPPRYDGTWDVCHVSVANWETMRRVYGWLTQTEHDFVSVVLDSITELQRRCKQNIASDGIIKGYDGWGQLLIQMDNLIRGFRDLTLAPGPVRCVVFVAETREGSGKWRPYMQGQIGVSLPYWVDICGYAFQSVTNDGDGNPTQRQLNLFVGTHPSFESGERVAGLVGPNIVNPHITHIMQTIYPKTDEAESTPQDKETK